MHVKSTLVARVCLRQTFPNKLEFYKLEKAVEKLVPIVLGLVNSPFVTVLLVEPYSWLFRWRRLKADLICDPRSTTKATFVVNTKQKMPSVSIKYLIRYSWLHSAEESFVVFFPANANLRTEKSLEIKRGETRAKRSYQIFKLFFPFREQSKF